MNPFEMVVLIVAIIAVAGVLRSRHAMRHERGQADGGEAQRLRDEVRTLKERVAVLERIITDRSVTLDQEIERLRDS